MANFLFDVDGTLTPSRKSINRSFRKMFGGWITEARSLGHRVFLVTGSDKSKSVQQLGVSLWRHISWDGCYQCSGNVLYIRNSVIKSASWLASDELKEDLKIIVDGSPWCNIATVKLEQRTGTCNFSTIGRNCSDEERQEYYTWDLVNKERDRIVKELSPKYPDLQFMIGGEISIDIFPKGRDKSQVVQDMSGETIYFGDRCYPNGNDYTISQVCDSFYNVHSWMHTREILKDIIL